MRQKGSSTKSCCESNESFGLDAAVVEVRGRRIHPFPVRNLCCALGRGAVGLAGEQPAFAVGSSRQDLVYRKSFSEDNAVRCCVVERRRLQEDPWDRMRALGGSTRSRAS